MDMSNKTNIKNNPYTSSSRPCNSKTLCNSHQNKTEKILCEKEQDVMQQILKVNNKILQILKLIYIPQIRQFDFTASFNKQKKCNLKELPRGKVETEIVD